MLELSLEFLWLLLLDQKSSDPADGGFLSPAPTAKPITRPGDILDSARNCLIELRWTIDDAKARRPPTRRAWDFLIGDVLAFLPEGPIKAKALRSLASMYANSQRRQWLFLGELVSPAGTSLYTGRSLFSHVPFWFIALEDFLAVTPTARVIPTQWCVSSLATETRPADSAALPWAPSLSRGSQIFSSPVAGDSISSRVRQLERLLYAQREGITYESCSDGTLRQGTASFAWRVTVDVENPDVSLYCEIGWVAGLPRSDAAELAGLICQLRRAPDRPGVRLCSDCNGVLLLIRRARSMSRTRLLKHPHRALLLEWLALEGQRRSGPVLLGWVRGHTTRAGVPFRSQRWCDSLAPAGARVPGDPSAVSLYDGRFVLLASDGTPVRGKWKEAIMIAGLSLLSAALAVKDERGEAVWHRLRRFFVPSDWTQTALVGKTSGAARLRLNAEADTVCDPAGERWTLEQLARVAGSLSTLLRFCVGCGSTFTGGWEDHVVGSCAATRFLLDAVDAVAIEGWAQEAAWDFAEALALFLRHFSAWELLQSGSSWQGFTLDTVQLGAAPPPVGVATTDSCNGAPVPEVFAPETVHAAAEAWAAAHPDQAQQRRLGGHWQRLHLILRSSFDSACTVVPAKLFELYDSWLGPPECFGAAVTALLMQEAGDHAASLTASRGIDDFWCWWGGFMAWCRRHFGLLWEGFTGASNRTGPLYGGYSARDSDGLWRLAHDAWSHNGRPRRWSLDGWASLFVANPPYRWLDALRFCRRAAVRPARSWAFSQSALGVGACGKQS